MNKKINARLRPAFMQIPNYNQRAWTFAENHPYRRTVFNFVQSDAGAAEFRRLLTSPNILRHTSYEFSLPGPYTFFVPTNEAINKIAPSSLDKLRNDEDLLHWFIRYHCVKNFWKHRDLSGSMVQPNLEYHRERMAPESLTSLNGLELAVRIEENPLGSEVFINNHHLTRVDQMCHNGVVHMIDGLLLPPSFPSTL